MKFKELKEWKEKLKQEAAESDKQAKYGRTTDYKTRRRHIIRLQFDQTNTKHALTKNSWKGIARRLKGLYS